MDCRCKKTLVPRCHTCRTAMSLLPLAKMRHQGKSCRYGQAGPSRTWRHNSIRDLLAKAIESAGFKIGYEHNGGLTDNRRPGDIIVYNWLRNKRLLIDVSVTNSLAAHNANALLRNGPGGGAETTGRTKRTKYRDIDASKYIYYPFVLETCGAFGKPAL